MCHRSDMRSKAYLSWGPSKELVEKLHLVPINVVSNFLVNCLWFGLCNLASNNDEWGSCCIVPDSLYQHSTLKIVLWRHMYKVSSLQTQACILNIWSLQLIRIVHAGTSWFCKSNCIQSLVIVPVWHFRDHRWSPHATDAHRHQPQTPEG